MNRTASALRVFFLSAFLLSAGVTGAVARPTIVLVHGAWADASSWSKVVERLQHDGYTVAAPPNPLRSLANDSAYLINFLKGVTGPIVLVGHSYGGAVITNAATGNPNVKALVYVDAYVPDQGETVVQLTSAKPGSVLAADPQTLFDFVPYPGAPAGDYDLYMKPGLFAKAFTGNLPAETAAVFAASQRPPTLSSLNEPSGAPAWKTIPSWDLIGSEDQIIPAAEQLALAKRANAHVSDARAPHLSMVSDPEAVTKVILDAARSAQ